MKTAILSVAAALLTGSGAVLASGETPLLPSLGEPTPSAGATPARAQLVPWKKLAACLPQPPPEWKGEKASGSTTDTEDIHLSTARRLYVKGEADDAPTAVITLIDSSSNHQYFDAAPTDWKQNQENEEGYDRRILIDGMRAFEHYNKAARTGSLSVFVAGRYFVQIELTNLDPAHLRDWLKRIDISALANLK